LDQLNSIFEIILYRSNYESILPVHVCTTYMYYDLYLPSMTKIPTSLEIKQI